MSVLFLDQRHSLETSRPVQEITEEPCNLHVVNVFPGCKEVSAIGQFNQFGPVGFRTGGLGSMLGLSAS